MKFLKKFEKEEGGRKARKRKGKEGKEEGERMMMMRRTKLKAALIQIDETQMME